MHLDFHNRFNYGDCMTSLHFIIRLMDHNPISSASFACKSNYHDQLAALIPSGYDIRLIAEALPNSYDVWCRALHDRMTITGKTDQAVLPITCQRYTDYRDVMSITLEYWRQACEDLGLKCPFSCPHDLLFDEPAIGEEMPNAALDALLINSYCMSGQIQITHHDQDQVFDRMAKTMADRNMSFMTTQKLNQWPCTADQGLDLVGIARLSKHARLIIGVPTSPFWMSMNKWAYERCHLWINLTNDYYTFDLDQRFRTVVMTPDININFG